MYRWLAVLLLMGALGSSSSARAQTSLRLSAVHVQLFPEYDQKSMLVICDFTLPGDAPLPLTISLRFPSEASLFAVAWEDSPDTFLNASYLGPTVVDTWQKVDIQVEKRATYHLEYYQPLSFDGNRREFSYVWPADYAADQLTVDIRLPPGASEVTTDPQAHLTTGTDGNEHLERDFGRAAAGQDLSLRLAYTKISTDLTLPQNTIRSSEPLGAATQGRVMLSNYLPYAAGVLGVALIAGGIIYFWQSSRGRALVHERRHRRAASGEGQPASEIHCRQCGTRAYAGDRFCRVCGTRLRQPE